MLLSGAAAFSLSLFPVAANAKEAVGLSGFSIAEEFDGGTGTAEDPYQIADAGQMALLSSLVNNEDYSTRLKYNKAAYILTADIALNNTSDFENWETSAPQNVWRAIGEEGFFQGTFDGDGHTVSGMYICSTMVNDGSNTNQDGSHPGLFGNISGGTISNVILKDSMIIIQGKPLYVGGLAAYTGKGSEIYSCESDVTIISVPNISGIGGLIGTISGSTVKDCSGKGTIRLSDGCSAGGLIGTATGDEFCIDSCSSETSFTALEDLTDMTNAGGLIGHVSNGTDCVIIGCSNASDMDLGAATCGGIVGLLSLSDRDSDLTDGENRPDGRLTIRNCVNTGSISSSSGQYPAAGIVERILGTSSYTDSEDYIALSIDSCRNEGAVTGNYGAAGIVGDLDSKTGWEILSCENSGSISAQNQAAGIAANVSACEKTNRIDGCLNSGEVHSDASYAGGILCNYFGFSLYVADDADVPLNIHECTNKGTVSGGSGIMGLGGIMGAITSAESCMTIDSCFNYGEIRSGATTRSGGILGCTEFAILSGYEGLCYLITGCENHGDLILGDGSMLFSSDNFTENEPSEEALENYTPEAVNSGALVLGGPSAGGIIGFQNNGGIENCVNTASIYLDSTCRPVLSHADIFNNAYEDSAMTNIVFAGGICGLYMFDDSDDTETTYLRNCTYSGPSPIGWYAPINEDGIENVTQEDA